MTDRLNLDRTFSARRVVVLCGVLLASLSSFSVASAGPGRVIQRLLKAHQRSERYTVRVPDAPLLAGAARAHVGAPASTAQRVITDFGRYGRMLTNLDTANVLGRHGDRTDVYVRAPVARGTKSLWAVLRFEPFRRVSPREHVMTARLLRGNVERFDVRVRVIQVDADDSLVELEMLVDVDMPVPGALVTEEAARAADKIVRRFRNNAEKQHRKR